MRKNKRRIAFIVGRFPVVSETFIINQVADLIDRGIEIEIFSFRKGDKNNISQRFYEYNMFNKVHYLDTPHNLIIRVLSAIPRIIHILFTDIFLLFKILNFKNYGRKALNLNLLFKIEPFVGKRFDLFHCHFGRIANDFLMIKEILGLEQRMVTSFYGRDVSCLFEKEPENYYDKLKRESSLFFVMSHNMKDRIIDNGFDHNKIRVLPVSIDVNSYPYKERNLHNGELIKIISVGRFIEKKGFDDILRALAIVKEKSKRLFKCYIIGDGVLKDKLLNMTENLKLWDVVEFKGYMKVEDIIKMFSDTHLFLQPSKTASDGDME